MLILIGLLLAASGLLVGTWWGRPDLPRGLEGAHEVRDVEVTFRSIDDGRPAALRVVPGVDHPLDAPVAGRVTASSCLPGGSAESGASLFSIDGSPIVSLALAVPPWRDLAVGDHGADVAALNAELTRLGEAVADGETLGAPTVAAYRALARRLGSDVPDSGIPLSGVLWLASPSVRIGSCEAVVGDRVEVGDPLARSGGLSTVQLVETPAAPTPGERDVIVGDQRLPVRADGVVDDPAALSALLDSDEYRTAIADDAGVRLLSTTWVLRTPVQVAVVPPGAVVGAGGLTCVHGTSGSTTQVEIVGSQLGQTFVVPLGSEMPARVRLRPADASGCV